MELALAGFAALVAVSWWISRVNARYETRSTEQGPQADEQVELAWEAHGLGDDEAVLAARFAELSRDVRPEMLTQKSSLVRYGVMAVRAGDDSVLEAVAQRAEALAFGCGETLSLRGLAAAYAGGTSVEERREALEHLQRAQQASAGCSRCSMGLDAQVLSHEVSLAEAMVVDELRELSSAARSSREQPADEPVGASGALLFVRKVPTEHAGD